MEVPLSVILVLIVVIACATVFAYSCLSKYPVSPFEKNVVSASIPLVYRWGSTYVLTIRFAKSEDIPVGVCRMTLRFHDLTGGVQKIDAVFAVDPSTYVNSVTVDGFTVSISNPVIEGRSLDAVLTINMPSPDLTLLSIHVYYCWYGQSAEPQWEETLKVPEKALTPG